MNVEFVVNSKPRVFANWLKCYIDELHESNALTIFIDGDEVFSYAPAQISPEVDDTEDLRLTIRGNKFASRGDYEDFTLIEPYDPDYVFISFTLTPLSSERTEVKAGAMEDDQTFYLILVKLIVDRYPEAAGKIKSQLVRWEPELEAWIGGRIASLPWKTVIEFSLADAMAACHKHLEYLASKRFPADWDVHMTLYDEGEGGDTIRYVVQSAGRMVGHVRLLRFGWRQTRLEVKAFKYGNDDDLHRRREIMAAFAERWSEELPAEAEAPQLRPGLASAASVAPGEKEEVRETHVEMAANTAGDTHARVIQSSEQATTDRFESLLEPFTLSWPLSRLKRWFEDFRDDSNPHLIVFHSPAQGYLNVYKDPFTQVGIKCEPQTHGQVRLTPYALDGATAEAIAELRQWRNVLEAALIESNPILPESGMQDEQSFPMGKDVRVPSSPARLQKWRKTWWVIKLEVKQDFLTGYQVAAKIKKNGMLQDKLRDCPQSGETLQAIINAGMAGELD